VVVLKNTRSVPTSPVKIPPALNEGVVDNPGGKYTRLMAVELE
jgi:hypothetical protein